MLRAGARTIVAPENHDYSDGTENKEKCRRPVRGPQPPLAPRHPRAALSPRLEAARQEGLWGAAQNPAGHDPGKPTDALPAAGTGDPRQARGKGQKATLTTTTAI